MVARGVTPPKIHDLTTLSRRLAALEPAWAWDEDDLDGLSDGAVAYRYPGESATPAEATQALATTIRIRTALLPLCDPQPAATP